VDAGRQHLEERGGVRGDRIRDGVEQCLVNGYQFREAAVGLTAEQPAVAAQVRQVAAAQVAATAEDSRVDHDGSAGRGTAGATGNLDPAGHLVAEDTARGDRDLASNDLDIGTADARLIDPHQGEPLP